MLSRETVAMLLALPHEQRTGPSGDHNKEFRRRIVREITGQNCNLSQCGCNRVRNLLLEHFGVDETGLCIAEADSRLVERMTKFVEDTSDDK